VWIIKKYRCVIDIFCVYIVLFFGGFLFRFLFFVELISEFAGKFSNDKFFYQGVHEVADDTNFAGHSVYAISDEFNSVGDEFYFVVDVFDDVVGVSKKSGGLIQEPAEKDGKPKNR